MKELKINHFAVLVAFVLQFLFGYLWYAPFLFGETWADMVGIDLNAAPSLGDWIHNIISAAVSMYVLAWLFTKLNVTTWQRGALFGFIIGFSFVLLSVKTSNAFSQLPYGLAWITAGFTTFGLTVAGIVLGAWPKYKE